MVSLTADEANEQAALEAFLRPISNGDVNFSTLDAALRDARAAVEHALWLGTLGFLIVVEMIGRVVARPNSVFAIRNTPSLRFLAGSQEFATRSIVEDDAEALYSLRCSLAHEFSLRNENAARRHVFRLVQEGELIVHAAVPWEPNTALSPANETTVNLREVAVFVEELVESVRSQHGLGGTVLARGTTAQELRDFARLMVT